MSPRFSIGLISLLALAPLGEVRADSYGPFLNYRQVDTTGQFYVVLRVQTAKWDDDPGRGGPVDFWYAERATDSEPVTDESDQWSVEEYVSNPKVQVRRNDITHGRGVLNRAPAWLLVSSTGLGFVTLDVYGYNYSDLTKKDALIVVSKDGSAGHRKSISDLFSDKEIASFTESAGGIWWTRGGWIDEKRKLAIVVGRHEKLFRAVHFETGEVLKVTSDVVTTAVAECNRGGLEFALEIIANNKLTGAKPHLPSLLADDDLPLAIRLRSAVALASLGDLRGATLVRDTALKMTSGYDRDQDYAIEHLSLIFGPDAPKIIRRAIRIHGDTYYSSPYAAMASAGKSAALPILLEMWKDFDFPEGQSFAAVLLNQFQVDVADPTQLPHHMKILREFMDDESKQSLCCSSVEALGKMGPLAAEALPLLRQLASKWNRRANRLESEGRSFGAYVAREQFKDITKAIKRVGGQSVPR